jgi:hypothetical protein
MTSIFRGLSMGLCALVVMGIAGCSTSNESEAAKPSNLGDAGVKVSTTPDGTGPKGYADWGKRDDAYKAGGYPGTGTKK